MLLPVAAVLLLTQPWRPGAPSGALRVTAMPAGAWTQEDCGQVPAVPPFDDRCPTGNGMAAFVLHVENVTDQERELGDCTATPVLTDGTLGAPVDVPTQLSYGVPYVGPYLSAGEEFEFRWFAAAVEPGDVASFRAACTSSVSDGGPKPICLPIGTPIGTPDGPVRVEDVATGMRVWTIDRDGHTVVGLVERIGSMSGRPGHHVVAVELADGRAFAASPAHPTISGLPVRDLREGDRYAGSRIVSVERVAYPGPTFDLRVSGDTGGYLVDGVPLGSTLAP